jgi:hypothetical protein
MLENAGQGLYEQLFARPSFAVVVEKAAVCCNSVG